MLSIQLNKSCGVTLYEQLYLHIKLEITSGRIPFEAKLPSKRKLEAYLSISQTTVETAYEQLVAEGYIESRPRKGYFVLAKEELVYQASNSEKNIPSNPVLSDNECQFDFYPGIIETSMFPFKKWKSFYREAISEEKKDLLLLGNPVGEFELRKEIQIHLYQARGVICSPDQIVIGAGVEQLLPQLVFLLGERVVYGVENPGYPLTRHVLRSYKRASVPIDVGSEGANLKSLPETGVNIMCVTPSHQFPLGSIMSANRRTQLLNWSHKQNDRYIIEDDYDGEFRYSGLTIPSLHSLDKGEKVIYLSTFSKSLMPSLRIGYMVLPITLMKRYRKEFSHYASCVSRIDQYVLARFMIEGFFEKHLNRMRNAYRKKLEITANILNKYQDKVVISGEKAGLHLLLTFIKNNSEIELIESAKRARIRVCGLSNFFPEDCAKNAKNREGIVLGFGGLSDKKLEMGLKKLLECWFPDELHQ